MALAMLETIINSTKMPATEPQMLLLIIFFFLAGSIGVLPVAFPLFFSSFASLFSSFFFSFSFLFCSFFYSLLISTPMPSFCKLLMSLIVLLSSHNRFVKIFFPFGRIAYYPAIHYFNYTFSLCCYIIIMCNQDNCTPFLVQPF